MLEKGWRRALGGTVFIGPAGLVYLLMVLVPIFMSFYYSLFQWNGIAPKVFAGADNLRRLLEDEMIRKTLWNSVKLTFWAVAIQLPVGMLLAVLLSGRIRGGNFFKTVYFFPVMLSTAVLGILWGQIYDPNIGLLNQALTHLGLDSWAQTWLGDERTSLGSVIAVVAWQYVGFYVVVYFSALQNVPEDLTESATIEGAGPLQLLLRIKLPLIWPVITFTILNAVVNSLRYFDLIYIMTAGGPNGSSEVIASYMYKQAFQFLDYGYGSAVSVFLFAFSLLIALLLGRLMRRETVQY
ncbi:sugar ABC transporter permease [Paenibacillus albicereus]|uniref:Sugar ABC transporter permease n=1 Tax=Paenibacillus albicereus TaxID=2726185 RepID=A0A6H2GUB7_9BACL|nr:sugar ABC transporter permease [Paenibacillus albicereus]QJC50985.1 sugar ABC transporter permease [Paenibacillus albicereus]